MTMMLHYHHSHINLWLYLGYVDQKPVSVYGRRKQFAIVYIFFERLALQPALATSKTT